MASAGFFSGGGRFKELLRKYGKVALGVHLSVSAASITGMYVAIKSNVDVESMLEKIGMGATSSEDQPQIEQSHSQQQEQQHPSINDGDFVSSGDRVQVDGSADQKVQRTTELAASSGGALALAILCNKALFPVRVPITIALTPPIARFLRARNIIKNAV